jgi:hypothetical protein
MHCGDITMETNADPTSGPTGTTFACDSLGMNRAAAPPHECTRYSRPDRCARPSCLRPPVNERDTRRLAPYKMQLTIAP